MLSIDIIGYISVETSKIFKLFNKFLYFGFINAFNA